MRLPKINKKNTKLNKFVAQFQIDMFWCDYFLFSQSFFIVIVIRSLASWLLSLERPLRKELKRYFPVILCRFETMSAENDISVENMENDKSVENMEEPNVKETTEEKQDEWLDILGSGQILKKVMKNLLNELVCLLRQLGFDM